MKVLFFFAELQDERGRKNSRLHDVDVHREGDVLCVPKDAADTQDSHGETRGARHVHEQRTPDRAQGADRLRLHRGASIVHRWRIYWSEFKIFSNIFD